VIACSVTPSDGALDGPEAKATVTVPGGPLACSAEASVTSGQAPLAVAFTARPSGGSPPYTFAWDFGDGSAPSSQQAPSHTYAAAGSFAVTLAVGDAAGASATDAHLTVDVAADPNAPGVTSMAKAGSPFRLKVTGSNFRSGIQVFIGGDASPWTSLAFVSGTSLTIKGGKALKAKAPKGVPTRYRFRNPDGGECVFTYAW
jgi:PKD repeat protein